MRSILSVDARQYLVSLIPELCVRNELDSVTSELLRQKSTYDKNNIKGNDARTIEENIDFSRMIQNRYHNDFLRNQIRFFKFKFNSVRIFCKLIFFQY